MFLRYFAETLLVPLARGIRPFAFKEERMVNPMDFPCLYRFRKYRLRAVGLYPPVGALRTLPKARSPHKARRPFGPALCGPALRKPTPLFREMDITPT